MGPDRPTRRPTRRPTPPSVTPAETDPAPEPAAESATVKLGRYEIAGKRIRTEVWHLTGTHRLARYRTEWPDFWEAVDDMVALLDKDYPPYPLPTTTLFD
jgi:hypothetical protein